MSCSYNTNSRSMQFGWQVPKVSAFEPADHAGAPDCDGSHGEKESRDLDSDEYEHRTACPEVRDHHRRRGAGRDSDTRSVAGGGRERRHGTAASAVSHGFPITCVADLIVVLDGGRVPKARRRL